MKAEPRAAVKAASPPAVAKQMPKGKPTNCQRLGRGLAPLELKIQIIGLALDVLDKFPAQLGPGSRSHE